MKILNKITVGISQTLESEFNGLPHYIDNIEQDLDEPCFLVTSVITKENHIVMKRYERNHPMLVQYFPKNEDYRTECNAVSEKLFNCLELINIEGGLIRGSNMDSHIEDGVLNFEVTYEVQIFKVKTDSDEEEMENLESDVSVKE